MNNIWHFVPIGNVRLGGQNTFNRRTAAPTGESNKKKKEALNIEFYAQYQLRTNEHRSQNFNHTLGNVRWG